MEIYAAIAGLELLKQPCKVTLHSDSQHLVNAIMKDETEACRTGALVVPSGHA